MPNNEINPEAACNDAGCFLSPDRREFLRRTMFAVAGALMSAGCSTAAALGPGFGLANGNRRTRDNTLSFAVPATDGAQLDKENEVILVRWQNAIYAFDLSCPHQNTALRWDSSRSDFECPKHHSEFKPTGDYVPGSGRATRNMDRFQITREGNSVRVNLDKLYQQDKQPAEWAAAAVRLA